MNVTSLLYQITSTINGVEFKRLEGATSDLPLIAAIAQISMVGLAFEQINQLLVLSGGWEPVPFGKSLPFYLAIPCLYGAKWLVERQGMQEAGQHASIARTVTWLSRNVGSACLLAHVVTNVGLFYLGYNLYAAASLSLIAFDYLRNKECLPEKVVQVYKRIAPFIALTSCYLNQSWLTAIPTVTTLVIQHRPSPPAKTPYASAIYTPQLTWEHFLRISEKTYTLPIDLKINRAHTAIDPTPIQGETISLRKQIFLLLQEERVQLLQHFHHHINNTLATATPCLGKNSLLHLLDGGANSPHSLSRTMQIFGDHLGLPKQQQQAIIPELSWVLEKIYRVLGFTKEQLWTYSSSRFSTDKRELSEREFIGYTTYHIIDVIQSTLSLTEIDSWAREWIQRQPITDEEKQQWMATHFKQDEEGKLPFNLVAALLIDIDILTFET
jgi:hypothetical protein